MSKDYLTLVNDVIRESGTHLDYLTSSTFATTTDPMYTRFRNWVQEAYKRLQIDRGEIEFMQKRATILVSPRLLGTAWDLASEPTVGQIFKGAESGCAITVASTWGETVDGAIWADVGDAYLNYVPGAPNGDEFVPFKLNEPFDEYSFPGDGPAFALSVFVIKGFGRYNLQTAVTDLFEADNNSFQIQSTGDSPNQDNDSNMDLRNLVYVPWANWQGTYRAYDSNSSSLPQIITTAPDGTYEIFPRLQQDYILHFNYLSEPGALSVYSDIPSNVPSEYHDAIVWRAVMFYAKYDRQFELLASAKEEFEWYKQKMDRNLVPTPTFGRSIYDDYGYWGS